MNDFTLREYTQEEYDADMKKLLSKLGLHSAVENICDEINDITSVLGYVGHRTVQEYLCDILYIIDLYVAQQKASNDEQ